MQMGKSSQSYLHYLSHILSCHFSYKSLVQMRPTCDVLSFLAHHLHFQTDSQWVSLKEALGKAMWFFENSPFYIYWKGVPLNAFLWIKYIFPKLLRLGNGSLSLTPFNFAHNRTIQDLSSSQHKSLNEDWFEESGGGKTVKRELDTNLFLLSR